MNVARDFSDSRMETQDKAGDDGAQADDGKSYEIPDNQDEADTAASTNAGGATGSQELQLELVLSISRLSSPMRKRPKSSV